MTTTSHTPSQAKALDIIRRGYQLQHDVERGDISLETYMSERGMLVVVFRVAPHRGGSFCQQISRRGVLGHILSMRDGEIPRYPAGRCTPCAVPPVAS